jgi:hypothetical protein
VPDPTDDPPLDGDRVPNVSLQVPGLTVAYRNHPVVELPPGLDVASNVADVPVRFVALPVVVVGGLASVVNESTEPNAVEPEFRPMAQK